MNIYPKIVDLYLENLNEKQLNIDNRLFESEFNRNNSLILFFKSKLVHSGTIAFN